MKIDIRGIVWTPGPRAAIVNDVEVEEGDMLKDQVFVKTIEEDSVIFEYKLETDKRVMLEY